MKHPNQQDTIHPAGDYPEQTWTDPVTPPTTSRRLGTVSLPLEGKWATDDQPENDEIIPETIPQRRSLPFGRRELDRRSGDIAKELIDLNQKLIENHRKHISAARNASWTHGFLIGLITAACMTLAAFRFGWVVFV